MRFFFTILFLALITSGNLKAQDKSFPGFYINLQGEMVKGVFPNYTQWHRNPSRVSFQTPAGETIELTPENCRSFIVEGYDQYIAYTGPRLVNPIEDHEVIRNRTYTSFQDEQAQVSTFLRLVTNTAQIELFAYTDQIRTNYFYRLPGQPLTELRYKLYYDQDKIHEVADYKQQFNNLFAEQIEQKKLQRQLERLTYREDPIEKFLAQLFPLPAKTLKPENLSGGWTVAGGVSLASVKAKGDQTFVAVLSDYETSVSPVVSVGYLISMDRSFSRFFFHPQLKISRFNTTGKYPYNNYILTTTYKTAVMLTGETNLGVNVINREKLRIFLSGGLGILTMIRGREVKGSYFAYTGEIQGKQEAKLNKLAFSMNGSAGVLLNKKMILTTTYMFPVTVVNFSAYRAQLSAYQLTFGYKLQ